MPGFIAKKLCPNLVIVPPNFDKYRAVSDEVSVTVNTHTQINTPKLTFKQMLLSSFVFFYCFFKLTGAHEFVCLC